MIETTLDPTQLLVTGRKITGMSAILLPFLDDDSVDWDSLRTHISRTVSAGIAPAVNMDTGYANLIDEATCREVLRHTQELVGNVEYIAGAFVADTPDSAFSCFISQCSTTTHEFNGTPIIFQTYGLTLQDPDAIVESYAQIGEHAPRFIAFELGTMFAPFGKIYSLEVYKGLLGAEQCVGAKHSSLSRELEWQRLQLRNETRTEIAMPQAHCFLASELALRAELQAFELNSGK